MHHNILALLGTNHLHYLYGPPFILVNGVFNRYLD